MPHFPNNSTLATSDGPESDEARSARLSIKTRRRRYLEKHPEYFDSPSLELADPLLYDRMIRRFQSAAEREVDGRKKGYSGMLEADMMRSEAKVAALAHPDPNSPLVYQRDASGTITAVEQDEEDRPKSRQEGMDKWKWVMGQRFLRGEDHDFEYNEVDGNDQYNDWAEDTRKRQDEYFDGEEAEFIGEGRNMGETGVQDF